MSDRPSYNRAISGDYRPSQPSALRHSHRPSSIDPDTTSDFNQSDTSSVPRPSSPDSAAASRTGGFFATETTPLVLPNEDRRSTAHHSSAHGGVCTHGTFSPRPESPTNEPLIQGSSSDGSTTPGSGTRIPILDNAISTVVGHDDWKKWLKRRMRTKKMGQSSELAEQAGIRDTPLMFVPPWGSGWLRSELTGARYLSYYMPCLTWLRQYKLSFVKGDLISALTMASFYLPMALSYASNLAHVPPIHGLYAFVFNPFIYAIFGSCSQLVVGPEAAGSLMVGAAVKSSVDTGHGDEDNALLQARICGVITGMAGGMVLIAGLIRLGFLDSVLSRPFLRGFISAIGFVITVDQLIPELGLVDLADELGVSHGSSIDKIAFMAGNIDKVHRPTLAIAGISFVIIMVGRYVVSIILESPTLTDTF